MASFQLAQPHGEREPTIVVHHNLTALNPYNINSFIIACMVLLMSRWDLAICGKV